MAASMRSARLHEPGQPLRIDTVEIPEPRPRDVLVQVKACGIIPNMKAIFSGRLCRAEAWRDRGQYRRFDRTASNPADPFYDRSPAILRLKLVHHGRGPVDGRDGAAWYARSDQAGHARLSAGEGQ